MSLRRLCFVLPMDGDELLVADHDAQRRRPRQKLGSYVRGKVGRALSCLRCGGCHGDDDSRSMGFEDMAGVYELGSRKIKGASTSGPRVFSYSELYIGTSGFSDDEVLGSGGFGRVYRAVLPSDGTTVAVKCVASVGVDRYEKSFLAELAAVARLRHRNLVRLRGWCVRDEEELLLVYDYMPNRSLDRLLFSPAKAPALGWDRRRRIVAGLAAALLYLHEQLDTQIIHRDVKTSNVMLDSEFNARLGDFGLARWLEHAVEDAPPTKKLELLPSPPSVRSTSSFSSSANYQFRLIDTSRIGGTIGYLPPESFQRSGAATAKSDVFSFGIVLLEVATGRRVVDLAYPDDQIFMLDWVRRLSDEGKLLNAGDRRLPEGGMFDMVRLIHLGLLCSMHDPRARPTMKWVVENISGSCSGDLPPLPSFLPLPKYISLTTSSSDSSGMSTTMVAGTNSTTTSAISASTNPMYDTAAGTTIYLTAEDGIKTSSGGSSGTEKSGSSQRSSPRPVVAVPNVDTPREISYKEIVAITNDFSESQVVAELDFGTGYEGFLDTGHGGHVHVLVKRLGMKTCPALRVRFANELCNLAKLRHRNLVQLRGWCTDHGEMLVVYDHSPGNLLSHHLLARRHSDSDDVLSWRHRYGIVRALASAVLYLHEEWDEQVIHRNITSSAVFLDPDRSPRLGSFALAEFLSRNEHSHHVVVPTAAGSARGIFGYMAPEYMESGEATTMADVYSFGVVVLEVVTGVMAVDSRTPEVLLVRKVQLCQEEGRDVVEALADRRLDVEALDRQELLRLAKLGIACTSSDPAARPSMRKIVSILDGNDEVLSKFERRTESREEWETKNAAALSLVRRLQALGIH